MLRRQVAVAKAEIAASIAGVDGFMVSTQIFIRADRVASHRKAVISHVDQVLAHRSVESLP